MLLTLLLKDQKCPRLKIYNFLKMEASLFDRVQVRGQLSGELLQLRARSSIWSCRYWWQNHRFNEVWHNRHAWIFLFSQASVS